MSSINNDISQLKKIILDTAIRGKLVPQDENDEDAGILLEKIKAEKEKLIKEGEKTKDKPLPEIKSEEIPFELPKSWRWVWLGNIASISTGRKDADEGDPNGDYNFYTCAIVPIKSNSYSFFGESLILPGNGANVGYVRYVNEQFEAYQRTYVVNKIIIIYVKYLYYVFKSRWKTSLGQQYGSAINYIKLGNLTNYAVPIPPIPEQQRIVAKIESLFKLADEIDSRRISLAEKVKQLKSAILQEAIAGKLVPQDENDEDAGILLEKIKAEKEKLIKEGKIKKDKPLPEIKPEEIPFEIPKSWRWVRLGDVGNWGAGSTPNRSANKYWENGTFPWLKTGELTDGEVVEDTQEKINDLALKECNFKISQPNDILIAMYGATIGKLGIAKYELVTNQACCSGTVFISDYLHLFYYLLYKRSDFIKQGAGGAQPNISKEKIVNTLYPLPPLSEQKRIVEELNKFMFLIDQLEQKLTQSKELTSKLNEAILNETLGS